MTIVIPKIQPQVAAPQQAPSPQISTNVSGLGAIGAVGAGIAAIGVGVDEHAQKAREVNVNNAETAYRAFIDDTLAGPVGTTGQGYLSTKAQTAMLLAPDVEQRIRERGEEIAAALPDDDSRAAFGRFQNDYYLSAREKIQGHAYDQGQQFALDSQWRSQDSYVRSASADVMSGVIKMGQTPSLPASVQGLVPEGPSGTQAPAMVGDRSLQETLDVAHLSWHAFAGQNGLDDATTAEGIRQITSRFWAEAINAALAPGDHQDPILAKMLFDKHGAEISETHAPAGPNTPGITVTRADVADNVERAYVVAEGSRQATAIFSQFAGDEGSWSDRSAAMDSEIKKLPADVQPHAMAAKDRLVKQQQDRETAQYQQEYSDLYSALITPNPQTGAATLNGATLQQDPRFIDLQRHDPEKAVTLIKQAQNVADGKLAVNLPEVVAQVTNDFANPKTRVEAAQRDYTELIGLGLDEATAAKFNAKAEGYRKNGLAPSGSDAIIHRAAESLYSVDIYKASRDSGSLFGFARTKLTADEEKERLKKEGEFYLAADAAITTEQQATEKQLTPARIQEIMDDLTASVALKSGKWGTVIDLSTEFGGLVPPSLLVHITEDLKQHGEAVTEQSILRQLKTYVTSRSALPSTFPDMYEQP